MPVVRFVSLPVVFLKMKQKSKLVNFRIRNFSGYVINFPIRPPGRNPCEAVADVTEEFNRWAVTNLNATNPTCLGRIQEVCDEYKTDYTK